MMDARLRLLERRYRETGSVADKAALVRERVRAGLAVPPRDEAWKEGPQAGWLLGPSGGDWVETVKAKCPTSAPFAIAPPGRFDQLASWLGAARVSLPSGHVVRSSDPRVRSLFEDDGLTSALQWVLSLPGFGAAEIRGDGTSLVVTRRCRAAAELQGMNVARVQAALDVVAQLARAITQAMERRS